MPKPPPLAARSSAESPLDRALGLAASGDGEGSVRQSAALVKAELGNAPALYVLGRGLSLMGHKAGAASALEIAADRAADSGNLPLAIAALVDLHGLGADIGVRADAIARAYAKGSPRLRQGGATPPSPAPNDVSPMPSSLSGSALADQVLGILEYARAAADTDRAPNAALPAQNLFSSLTAPGLRALVQGFTVRLAPKGARIVVQGAAGAEAFVLARGELEVMRESKDAEPLLLARLGNGAVFGEMALLSRAPRAASVIAAKPSVLLEIGVDALDAVAQKSPEVGAVIAAYCHKRMVANLVRTSPLLGPLSAGERQALIERFSAKTFETGAKLVAQGRESDGLHVIASGQVSVLRKDGEDEVVIARLSVGEVVGEVSLVFRRPSNADVVAEHPTMTLFLPRARFMEIVREHPTLLSQLYELAVKRDEETSSIVAQEAAEADDLII